MATIVAGGHPCFLTQCAATVEWQKKKRSSRSLSA
jgi:hypothetical protein